MVTYTPSHNVVEKVMSPICHCDRCGQCLAYSITFPESLCGSYWDVKTCKDHLYTIAEFYFCRTISSHLRHLSTVWKNLLNRNISTCPDDMCELLPTKGCVSLVTLGHMALQQILTGFTSWLRCCTDVAQWRSTELCTMFGNLLVCLVS